MISLMMLWLLASLVGQDVSHDLGGTVGQKTRKENNSLHQKCLFLDWMLQLTDSEIESVCQMCEVSAQNCLIRIILIKLTHSMQLTFKILQLACFKKDSAKIHVSYPGLLNRFSMQLTIKSIAS